QVLVGPRRSTPCPGPTRPSADLPRNGEELRAFANGLFGLAWFDVDPIAGQLRGEAGVLTVAADGEGQLSSRHQHRGGAGDAVDRHPLDLRRAERRRHESLGIIRPRNDVHVLVGELAQDRSVSHTLGSDARADRVEARLGRRYRDLRPQTWFAGDGADLHGARLDLRHLGLAEAMDESALAARTAELRLAAVVLRVEDDDEDRAAGLKRLAGDLLFRRHHTFRPPEVHVDDAGLDPVDDPAGELAPMLGDVAQ